MMSSESEWITGRVGMLYRDLTPESLRSRVIVSHIRLPFDGEVPDYVHYHKIDFQMIYCVKGRIKVVYEDQGEPFWLESGDCVLQPPEIRHRVLECTAGAEVIEISIPAEHKTWVDHEMELPTSELRSDRLYGTQPFIFLKANAGENKTPTCADRLTEIAAMLPECRELTTSLEQIRPLLPNACEDRY